MRVTQNLQCPIMLYLVMLVKANTMDERDTVGYVSGDVFPIIQNIDKFTMNAMTPDSSTKPYS